MPYKSGVSPKEGVSKSGNMAHHVHIFLHFTLIFIVFFCHISNSSAGKYTKSKNIQENEDLKNIEKPFRMQKINILWQKAQKRLTSTKLKDLYYDLKIHDKEELALKHLKSSGGDKEGMKEADLRDKLHAIMDKFNLLQHFNPKKGYQSNDFNESIKPGDESHPVFKDKKLNKLWEKAKRQAFSDDVLQMLQTEFQHHQDKLDEYYELMDEIKPEDDYLSNSISQFNMVDDEQMDYKDRQMKLKKKHRDLTQNYQKLMSYSEDGIPTQAAGFTEPKVIELWNQAQNSNFSSTELLSFREELLHFEHKLKKLKFYQEKVAISTDQLNKSGKLKLNAKPQEHQELELKAKHFNYKVEKLHRDIQARLSSQHSEL